MEDSERKIKTVEPITPIKTIEPVTLAKNIVSIPIEFVFASITIPVESVCDNIPRELVFVESFEFVKNSFPYNMISNSA